ncbi:MAG: proprotein convertase P-domain-containing protein [Saprospiraceae bacterium]|nr:proprotein convertase P-domain-containing protein [Saprospiraceae bacterium]
MKKVLTTLSLALACHVLFAQAKQNPWLDTPISRFATKGDVRQIVPERYRSLTLDLDGLKAILEGAPMRFSPEAEAHQATLAVPMPDGSTQVFQVVEAPVMHPDLAARYPYMRSFAGWSKADGTAYLRCGYTQEGFHAMVLSAKYGTVYIDRFREGDDQHYISYFKKDYRNPHAFECLVESEVPQNPQSLVIPEGNLKSILVGDCQHRGYTLALACTGEYAAFHGGTKPLVLAEYNVAITRINGIYEREMAVTLTMVANTDLLIYLNAATDPYTNNNGGTMLSENQTTCNNVIGNANYDIGHVFSTGGGGVAYLGAVCDSGSKAGGVTGLSSPIGDPFYVDYVAHEMGHQFGADHTQNNSCNRNDATAMEPGSASTIMGYAGICAPNVQNNSDDYFHAISLNEIHNHITGSVGNSCATTTSSGNNAPVVTVPINSYNIPKSTPFVLTAQATDSNASDVLTYCWEQMDPQVATMPPVATNTGGPAFRSFDPVTSPSRYFPSLSAIIAGTTPTWEVLPSVARSMNFRCTVRDNHPGAGCADEADVAVNVNGSAGPFVVTNPNTSSVVWTGGSMATVTWNVAGTNQPPISTSQVEILLSADGGNTYAYTLLATTSNDGTESVLVPNINTTQARVMIKAKNNVYFDISNQNFRIELAVNPSFALTATADTVAACQSGQALFTYNMLQLAGFNQAVSFTASGLPAGATASFTPNNIAPPAPVVLTVGNLTGIAPGTYPFTVTATGGSITVTDNLVLVVLGEVSAAPSLSTPSDGAEVTTPQPTLTWAAVPQAASYLVEVSETPAFATLVASATLTTTSYQVTAALNILDIYYWRVKAINPCSETAFSAFNAFHLGGVGCQSFSATGLPLAIPTIAGTVTKTLNIPLNQSIVSVKTSMNIGHSYIGDLDVKLVSPQNTTRVVFDRPGVPVLPFGCQGDDINASFGDSFTNTAGLFDSTCLNTVPSIIGNYQPLEAFSAFAGQNAQGNWTLRITDNYDQDGGALLTWSMEVCGLTASTAASLLQNNVLSVAQGQTAVISNAYLQGQGTPAAGLDFILLTLPAHGQLILNGAPLAIGSTFTQAELDANLLSYQHDGSSSSTDEFKFDYQNNAGNWLHAQVFHINVIQNNLAATAAVTQPINCAGANNGQITVSANGGNAPLQYSLNGGAYQNSNVFGGLAPGVYSIEVKDATGFVISTNQVEITAPTAISASASVNSDVITVTASGGTGSLQYSIGAAPQSSNVFSGVANGAYTVTVSDANGCTATTSALVAVNTLVVAANLTTGIRCFGESNATLTVSVAGGTPAFQYRLNGGAPQSSNVFSNLGPGSYTVQVTDADGFTQTTNAVTISNPAQLTASAAANNNTILVTATGGTGSLQYSIGGAPQSSSEFSNLPNGSYTVTVTDANGCTATATATVFVNNVVATASITGTLDCFNGTDGQITVTGSGGMAPYQYSLNGGAFQSSNVFSNLAAGSYTATVRDADGLIQNSQPITLAAPPQITVTALSTGYTLTVTASGGTGSLQYSLDGGAFQGSNSFSPVTNGNHTVTVRDANGCEANTNATVSVAILAVSGSVTQPISCPGESDGQITAVGTGGVPAYQYSLNGGAFQNSGVFGNLAAGSYTLTIKDSGGFTSSSSVNLTAPPSLVVAPSANNQTVTVSASGGTPPYQYKLDNGALQSSNIFNGVPNGLHTITVVDAHGCTKETTVQVGGLPPNIFVSLSHPVSCHGGSDGVITVSSNGGVPPYTFSLNGGAYQSGNTFAGLSAGTYTVSVKGSDGAITSAPNIVITDPPLLTIAASVSGLNISVTGTGGTGSYQYSLDGTNFENDSVLVATANGSYNVTIRDERGCTATTTVTVNTVTGINLAIDEVSCTGETDGQLEVTGVTGGVPPYLYALNGGAFASQNLFTGLAPGDYIISIQDATGTVFEAPAVALLEPDALTADFQLAQNNLTILANGGTGTLSYSIDGGDTFQSSNQFNDLPIGTYQVVVKDENGCTFTGEVVVTFSGTGEQFGKLGFEVMPNPSNGLFLVKLDLQQLSDLELAVFDVVGRQVFAAQMEAVGAAQFPLDLQGMASGTYLLRVKSGEEWGAKKLVILEK